MNGFFWSLMIFLIAISLLVAIHEYGHYLVARMCGVKVLRFSIGFGKPILKWRSKKDIEYVLGIFPIGGYVKMLDEREGEVPTELLPHAFNRQVLWKRFAIVFAGPFFNFLFAIFAYWAVFVAGVTTKAPLIGAVEPNSIAAIAGVKANDEIIKIDNKQTPSWRAVRLAMIARLGSRGKMSMELKNHNDQQLRKIDLSLVNWKVHETMPQPLKALGIKPFIPQFPAEVGSVLPESPAARAGLQKGDRIIQANGTKVTHWREFADVVGDKYEKPVKLIIKRGDEVLHLTIIPETVTIAGEKHGRIGVMSKKVKWPEKLIRKQHYSWLEAGAQSLVKTWDMTILSLKLMAKMVTGKVSVRSVSGPIGIAQMAGATASYGWIPFANFLGLVSISLG